VLLTCCVSHCSCLLCRRFTLQLGYVVDLCIERWQLQLQPVLSKPVDELVMFRSDRAQFWQLGEEASKECCLHRMIATEL